MDIKALIGELSSADVGRRRAAAETLSREGAAGAVVPLLRACGDPDEQVGEFATAALEALGAPPRDVAAELAEQLTDGGPAGYWSATLLGRLAADAAPWAAALGSAVRENSDTRVRQRAAWALGQIGPAATAGVAALEAATRDADARLARLATEALQKINAV